MLRSTNVLKNYVLEAVDGELGRCKDFLFDDQRWVVRYMVADTHKWLPGRKVLIGVISLGKPDWDRKRFPVHLTREAVEASPPLDDAAPVSRIEERRWARHYGYGVYWAGPETWGGVVYPHELRDQTLPEVADDDPGVSVHIRSTREVIGYQVHAIDGVVGRVTDFVLDDTNWRVSHMLCAVDARIRRPDVHGEPAQALLAPAHVVSVDWASQMVNVDQMRENLVPAGKAEQRSDDLAARH
jgi:hypothetical protein